MPFSEERLDSGETRTISRTNCQGADEVAQGKTLVRETPIILKINVGDNTNGNGDSVITIPLDEFKDFLKDVFGAIAKLEAGDGFYMVLHDIAHRRGTVYAKDFMRLKIEAETGRWL